LVGEEFSISSIVSTVTGVGDSKAVANDTTAGDDDILVGCRVARLSTGRLRLPGRRGLRRSRGGQRQRGKGGSGNQNHLERRRASHVAKSPKFAPHLLRGPFRL
jgi:hypothetical protein